MAENRLQFIVDGNTNPALQALGLLDAAAGRTKGELGQLDDAAQGTQKQLDTMSPAAREAADGLEETSQAAGEAQNSVEAMAHQAVIARDKVEKLAEGAELLEHFTEKLNEVKGELLEAAESADDLNDSLRGAFGDAAEEVGALAQKLGTGFQVIPAESVAQAGKELKRLGAYSEEALTRVTNASAGTGEAIEGLADAYGNFQKFGDEAPRALMTLQRALGASSKDLQDFGAVLDEKTGKVLLDTQEHLDAARKAFDRFTDAHYGDALEKMADPAARLKGETELLKQELGRASIELRESFAPALLSAIQAARGLSPELKGAIGLAVDFGGAALGAGSQALGLAVQLKQAGVTLAGVQGAATGALGAITGLSVGVGAFIGIAAALGVALVVATEIQIANNKANEEALKIEEARARSLHEHKKLIGETAEEMRKQGATAKDVAELILAMDDQIEEARKRGDDAAVARYQAERQRLMGIRKEFATTEAQKRQETQKTAVSVEDEAAAKKKAQEDSEKAAEAARKEELAAALHLVEQKAAARELDKQGEIDALKQVLAAHKTTADERRSIEMKIAGLQGQLADTAVKNAEEANKKQLELEHRLAEAKAKTAESDVKAQDAVLAALQRRLDKGEKVLDQLVNELGHKEKLQEMAIREKALADSQGKSAAEAAEIRKQAENEIQTLRLNNEQALADLKTKNAEREKKQALELLQLEIKRNEEKMAALADEEAKGKNVNTQKRVALEQHLALKTQEVSLQAEINGLGKDATTQTIEQGQAQLAITTATREHKKQLDDLLKKQQDLTAEVKRTRDASRPDENDTMGNLSGDTGAADDSRSAWLQKVRAKEEAKAKRAEELDRENVREGDRFGKTVGGETPADRAAREAKDARGAEEMDRIEKRGKGGTIGNSDVENKGPWTADSSSPRESLTADQIQAAVQAGVSAALGSNPQQLQISLDVQGAEVSDKSLYTRDRMPGQR